MGRHHGSTPPFGFERALGAHQRYWIYGHIDKSAKPSSNIAALLKNSSLPLLFSHLLPLLLPAMAASGLPWKNKGLP
jgi:hypothetical protein